MTKVKKDYIGEEMKTVMEKMCKKATAQAYGSLFSNGATTPWQDLYDHFHLIAVNAYEKYFHKRGRDQFMSLLHTSLNNELIKICQRRIDSVYNNDIIENKLLPEKIRKRGSWGDVELEKKVSPRIDYWDFKRHWLARHNGKWTYTIDDLIKKYKIRRNTIFEFINEHNLQEVRDNYLARNMWFFDM